MDYREYVLNFVFEVTKAGFYVYLPAQAITYLFGRMLGIFKKDWTRNLTAFLSMIGFAYWYVLLKVPFASTVELIYECTQLTAIGLMWYVLLGFHLYERVDNLLDKKLGDDEVSKRRKK